MLFEYTIQIIVGLLAAAVSIFLSEDSEGTILSVFIFVVAYMTNHHMLAKFSPADEDRYDDEEADNFWRLVGIVVASCILSAIIASSLTAIHTATVVSTRNIVTAMYLFLASAYMMGEYFAGVGKRKRV